MVQIYKTPFAAQGDKDAIPVPVQGDGAVSVTQGFGYDYEREYEDPAAKDIRREIMNGILHDLSEALGQIQQFGFAAWQAVDGGWPIGANVNHGGGVWQSLANANPEEPGTGSLWKPILFDNIGQANETTLGIMRIATMLEAQNMLNNSTVLTPKRLDDAYRGANQSVASGPIWFQKLPGGLLLQAMYLASATDQTAGTPFTWPLAFTGGFLWGWPVHFGGSPRVASIFDTGSTGGKVRLTDILNGGPASVRIFGIGYL